MSGASTKQNLHGHKLVESKKLAQLKDREYVDSARQWMEQQNKPVVPGCFKAAAAVYRWNKYDVAT